MPFYQIGETIMMKMVWLEFYKIFKARIFLVLLLLLLLANALLCYNTIPASTHEGMRMDASFWESVEYLCKTYNEDPEGYDQLFAEYEQAINEEFQKAFEDPEYIFDPSWSPTLIDGKHKDRVLFEYADKLIETENTYYEQIAILREQAIREMKQLRQEGEDTNGYVYRYQAYVYNQYTKILNETKMQASPVFGWDAYFSYSYADVFVFAMLILLSGLIFIPEKQSGMLPLMRSTKRGRSRVGIAKLVAASAAAVIVVLLFTASSCFVIYIKNGFANPFVPIQCIERFGTFPYVSTVFSYFWVLLGFKIVSALCFTALVTLISLICYQVLLTYIGGAMVFGICFALSALSGARFPFARTANLLSLAQGTPLVSRLYALNLFNMPVSYVHVAAVSTIFLTLVFYISTLCLYMKGNRGVELKGLSRWYQAVKKSLSAYSEPIRNWSKKVFSFRKKGRIHAHGLVYWEAHKILQYGNLWLILILCVTAQIIMCGQVKENYVNDFQYRDYLTYYADLVEGELSDEKLAYVHAELDAWAYLEARNQTAYQDFSSGKISEDDYNEFKKQYKDAYEKRGALEILEEKSSYLAEHYEKTGVKGHFLADQGMKAFLSTSFPIPLYAVVLILCVMSFAMEYAGKNKNDRFVSVMRSAKKGRKQSFRSKYCVVLLLILGLGILFYSLEAAAYMQTYSIDRSVWSAPLCSLQSYSQVDGGITIGQYVLVLYCLRMLALILTAVFMISVSVLAENLLLSVGVCVFFTMIPSVIARLGLESMKIFDFSAWFGANEYFYTSAATNLFGNDFGVLILFTVIFALITFVTAFFAHKKYIKG